MLGLGFLHPGTAGLRDTHPLAANDAPYPRAQGLGRWQANKKTKGA